MRRKKYTSSIPQFLTIVRMSRVHEAWNNRVAEMFAGKVIQRMRERFYQNFALPVLIYHLKNRVFQTKGRVFCKIEDIHCKCFFFHSEAILLKSFDCI